MSLEAYEKKIKGDNYWINIVIDPFNKRVRVDEYLGDFQACLQAACKVSFEEKAEKIIFKARKENFAELIAGGFLYEATIEKFFLGSDGCFFAKYLTNERRNSVNWVQEDQLLSEVLALPMKRDSKQTPEGYVCRKAEKTDAKQLAVLYSKVFEIYPVPMNETAYVEKCMETDTVFYVYTYNDQIISAAAAEVNDKYRNAEITDCATLPEHRQFGLMKNLIQELEKFLISQGVFCMYSIARSLSFGMNVTFFNLGYSYKGRLANNCYIFDKLEDMNIWVKNI